VLRYCSRISFFEVPLRQLHGQHDLAQLALDVALGGEQPVLHELLGDRRASLLDLARLEVLACGAEQSVHVDAGVVPERLVLHGDDRVLEDLRDLVELDVLTVFEADLTDDVAGRVVDDRPLRELTEALSGMGPFVLARARDEERAGHDERDRKCGAQGGDSDEPHEACQQRTLHYELSDLARR